MNDSQRNSNDREVFSRLEYRRFVAWPQRIQREAPLLLEVLESGPTRRVLDLGCATGEHSRFLAESGFQVTGVDRSEALIEEARRDSSEAVDFRVGDLRDLPGVLAGERFGGAVCLGNTLASLVSDEDLETFASGLARVLLPGAPLILQVLNYERLRRQGARYLPLNFSPEGNGWKLFLRLLEFPNPREVLFVPASLLLDYEAETPLSVVHAQVVRLRTWRLEELAAVFSRSGLAVEAVYGSFARESFSAEESPDLIVIARKPG
ncbi:MAG: hypothetical protein Kow00109_28790 [Acidobacteriota bacterium]